MNVRVSVAVLGLLCVGLTACSSQTEAAPEAKQAPLSAPSAATRSLSPEGGPVATLTPTPLASSEVATSEPAASPTPTPSVTDTEESEEDSQAVAIPKPKKSKKPKPSSQEPASNCDPNYSGACVPIVGLDLDCADIGQSLTVVGSDIHRFDADGDGAGCESY